MYTPLYFKGSKAKEVENYMVNGGRTKGRTLTTEIRVHILTI